MKILWISSYAPYDSVAHAGGQNHNYYVKYVRENTDIDFTLITVCNDEEKNRVDLDNYSIDYILQVYNSKKLVPKIQTCLGKILLTRDGGLLNNAKYHLILKALVEYYNRHEVPDVVITQWTEATLIYKKIKKLFPDSKYIAIEEDVAFLGYQRKYESSKGLYRIYRKIRYLFLKRAEINTLAQYNKIAVLNEKDKKLLLNENINSENILCMCPYFHKYYELNYNPNRYQLLFFGSMSRKENYLSAIWFIENVMPKLDKRFKFIIVGSKPSDLLLKYKSDRVIITGFVDSVIPYFEQSLCLVSSLLLGAGIKIKILESLSAGLPVITNNIGAEGIGLTDGENYIHCEKPEEYIEAINRLSDDEMLRNRLSENGRRHIKNNYDVDKSMETLLDIIKDYEK